jgi:hypothetical protein
MAFQNASGSRKKVCHSGIFFSISITRQIQPNGILCENCGVLMKCNNLCMSFVVHTNDHRSWTLYGVSTKKIAAGKHSGDMEPLPIR